MTGVDIKNRLLTTGVDPPTSDDRSDSHPGIVLDYGTGERSDGPRLLSWLGSIVPVLALFSVPIALAMIMNVWIFDDPKSVRPLLVSTICALASIGASVMMLREAARQNQQDDERLAMQQRADANREARDAD